MFDSDRERKGEGEHWASGHICWRAHMRWMYRLLSFLSNLGWLDLVGFRIGHMRGMHSALFPLSSNFSFLSFFLSFLPSSTWVFFSRAHRAFGGIVRFLFFLCPLVIRYDGRIISRMLWVNYFSHGAGNSCLYVSKYLGGGDMGR